MAKKVSAKNVSDIADVTREMGNENMNDYYASKQKNINVGKLALAAYRVSISARRAVIQEQKWSPKKP